MNRFLLFSLIIFPISALAEGGLPDKPYIYVEGKAEIEKPADLVKIGFDLVARAPDVAKLMPKSKPKQLKFSIC